MPGVAVASLCALLASGVSDTDCQPLEHKGSVDVCMNRDASELPLSMEYRVSTLHNGAPVVLFLDGMEVYGTGLVVGVDGAGRVALQPLELMPSATQKSVVAQGSRGLFWNGKVYVRSGVRFKVVVDADRDGVDPADPSATFVLSYNIPEQPPKPL